MKEYCRPRLQVVIWFILLILLVGCTPVIPPAPTVTLVPSTTTTSIDDLAQYAFPATIDPSARYMFYLHGKIIEDQGLPAISPDYGEYEYPAILARLHEAGFIVVSEQRPEGTDALTYAAKVVDQMNALLSAGVPAGNITVVGASKGAGIAIFVSDQLANPDVNYVLMAICPADYVDQLLQAHITLSGNVLSIYDEVDEYGGSCRALFDASAGLGRHEEIVLHVGTGHGILYHPLDEWIDPVVDWAVNQ